MPRLLSDSYRMILLVEPLSNKGEEMDGRNTEKPNSSLATIISINHA